MRLFSLSLLLGVFFIFSSCAPKGAVNINGQISDAANLNVYFDKITADGTARVLKNTAADASGKFSMPFEQKLEPSVYRIRVGAKSAYLLLKPEDANITISGTMASIGDNTYAVTGSPSSSKIQESLSQLGNARNNGLNIDDFLMNHEEPLIASFLAQKVYDATPSKANVYKKVAESLAAKYPTNEITTEFQALSAGVAQQAAAASRGTSKFNVGDIAPEIKGKTPDGKEIKLSDLKGKVVLIDFWASWCGPCRKANPHVVEVYDKYKSKGFDVFSFSLDGPNSNQLASFGNDQAKIKDAIQSSKKRWIDAIAQDNLKWKNHASELASWGSVANREYGVSSIPTTFLVDRDGKFAAINPRYNLEEAVQAAL